MQQLRSSFAMHRRWWLLGGLGMLVGLGGLLFLPRTCQAQPASPARATAPTAATAAAPPTLTWDYPPAAPERFVVRRSVDGGTWQDIAVLPGASGTGLTWEDTTLPAITTPVQARYTVYAVVGTGAQARWSEASNLAVAQVGEAEPVPLGECVLQQRTKKRVLITCNLP